MTKPRIALLVGSLSRTSINRRLAEAIAGLGAARFDFREVPVGGLPLYNRDLDGALPDAVACFKQQIETADGLMIVSPEYNRSITSALKNAIDWGSRPYGASSWRGKPAAIAGMAAGALGTAPAQQHLRNVLAHLDVHVLPQPEICMAFREDFFDADGQVSSPSTRQFLEGFLDRFATHTARFARVPA